MKPASLEKLVWVLIYSGLLLLVLGLAVVKQSAGIGAGLITTGAIVALVGAVLVYVRSRMKTPPGP